MRYRINPCFYQKEHPKIQNAENMWDLAGVLFLFVHSNRRKDGKEDIAVMSALPGVISDRMERYVSVTPDPSSIRDPPTYRPF